MAFRLRSVDPLTCDLPGPRIQHKAHRLPIAQERKARTVAIIHEELVARHGDDRDRCALVKIKERQRSTGLDSQLAIVDGDLKVGPSLLQEDQYTDDIHLDVRPLRSIRRRAVVPASRR